MLHVAKNYLGSQRVLTPNQRSTNCVFAFVTYGHFLEIRIQLVRGLEPRNLRKPLGHYIIVARRSAAPGVFKFGRHFQTLHPRLS